MLTTAHTQYLKYPSIGNEDGTISTWDLQARICLDRFQAHQREIVSIAILPHPDRLVTCSMDGSIKLWGCQDPERLQALYSIDLGAPYQDLQLSGVKGLNRSQLDTLTRLGARSESAAVGFR
jgi:WD40 repeat protein